MKICILTIATNKYLKFIEPLYNSIAENFLTDHDINCLLLTDHECETSDNVKVSFIDHEPWPMPTLKRYNYFLKEKDYILEHDYCFYLDADMRIHSPVGEEVLGDLVGTIHPWKFNQVPEEFSYERNPESLAYIPMGKGINYFAGGFNGGKTDKFIEMSEVIADRVNKDLENNIVAVWHDESHMNRYMVDNPPTKILTPTYCFPEELLGNPNYPFEPKIIALQKNHSALRT